MASSAGNLYDDLPTSENNQENLENKRKLETNGDDHSTPAKRPLTREIVRLF